MRQMRLSLKLASILVACTVMAASTGGLSTADGNISTARKFTASTFQGIQAIIDAAATSAQPLHLN